MIDKRAQIHISLTVTGRCNRGCKYCHFYASHDRAEVERDMKPEVFKKYVDYIKYLINEGYDITPRFSGGEPLVIQNEGVFEMSDYLYKHTGLKPYIMTNGKLLTKELIDKAFEHHIASFVVSCENPFKESEGAEHVGDVLAKYKALQNDKVPLVLGLVVVENSEFKNIKKIADFFYNEVGVIPPLSEKNFDTYERPTNKDIDNLKNNVREVVKVYNGVTDICLFPYIIPEIFNNTGDEEAKEYLLEFPLDDVYGYGEMEPEEALKRTNEVFDCNNIVYNCENKDCELHDYCNIIKWVWFDDAKFNKGDKMKDYCKMKKALVQGYYEALYEE